MFLDAIESGRYAEAYGVQAELLKREQTLVQFTQDAQKFRAPAGPLKFWRVPKVTWTKDAPRAPSAGIYVAIDLAGQFANVDRDCGYLVLFQPSGGDFVVMRRENNYLDNATVRSGVAIRRVINNFTFDGANERPYAASRPRCVNRLHGRDRSGPG